MSEFRDLWTLTGRISKFYLCFTFYQILPTYNVLPCKEHFCCPRLQVPGKPTDGVFPFYLIRKNATTFSHSQIIIPSKQFQTPTSFKSKCKKNSQAYHLHNVKLKFTVKKLYPCMYNKVITSPKITIYTLTKKFLLYYTHKTSIYTKSQVL